MKVGLYGIYREIKYYEVMSYESISYMYIYAEKRQESGETAVNCKGCTRTEGDRIITCSRAVGHHKLKQCR